MELNDSENLLSENVVKKMGLRLRWLKLTNLALKFNQVFITIPEPSVGFV